MLYRLGTDRIHQLAPETLPASARAHPQFKQLCHPFARIARCLPARMGDQLLPIDHSHRLKKTLNALGAGRGVADDFKHDWKNYRASLTAAGLNVAICARRSLSVERTSGPFHCALTVPESRDGPRGSFRSPRKSDFF